jgi:uncharacterized membrane protein YtjA (UPF0391 family)
LASGLLCKDPLKASRPFDIPNFKETTMLRAALFFLLIALVAGLLGLFGLENVSAQIAWVLFVVFIIMAVVSFIFGRGAPRSL